MADLEFEVTDGVATVLINRPERKNAFTMAMLNEWGEIISDARHNPDVRVIVLRGAGNAYCSGIDLGTVDDLGAGPLDQKELVRHGIQRIALSMQDLDTPTIAAINGVAVGGGFDTALMCDIRLAARSARVSEPYINLGFVPGAGALYYLPRMIGTANALEMLLTGDFYSAEECFRMGLVNHVYDDDELLDKTYELAGKIAKAPPAAVGMMKRGLYQSANSDLRTALDLVSSHMGILRSTEESKAALQAIQERVSRRARERGSSASES